jgi:hypothetical protein
MRDRRVLRACAWCGPPFVVLLFLGLLVAGFVPPPSPGESAEEVAASYRDSPDVLRLGLVAIMMGTTLSLPFAVVISTQLRRIEGRDGPMSPLQLVGGALGLFAVLLPVFVFMAAAYDPGRPASTTQTLHQLGWITFVMSVPAIFAQCGAIAVAILRDRGPDPLFPRWVGYYNVWVMIGVVPGAFNGLFHSGPMAWNGVLAFWVAAVVFGGWYLVMTWALLRAIGTPGRTVDEASAARAAA